ncbi:PREDICTED: transcription factor AIG1-like [Tarenaya hassleriana]|uniref:transcription factor AIG1-like n=1 Tax=Tarenaya hassleriana TaxID=28532 RepID=UPI00053C0CE5|nr:PREDICTED: transcription factor AIG1-like [Tarenaya hassleriana]
MYAMREEDCFQALHNNIQEYQDQFLLHNNQHQQILPWTVPSFDLTRSNHDSPPFGYSYFTQRDGFGGSSGPSMNHHQNHLRVLSEALGPIMRPGSDFGRFGFDGEMGKMTAQEIIDAKALAASKSHSEAERRRRERINNHLAKLRSILPNTTKTDKASLLAEVIQHMKELKRQTSLISDTCPVPTEADELTVDSSYDDGDGNVVIKASFCCQDRTDLMNDVINALKELRLKTLKAEITTVGGRVKNVLFISAEEDPRSYDDDNSNHNYGDDDDDDEQKKYNRVNSIQEALKAVIEKCVHGDNNFDQSSSGGAKRQRTNSVVNRRY